MSIAQKINSYPDGPVADSDDGYKLSHSDLWETCSFCGGSGEGMHEGKVCVACGGSGEVGCEE